MQQVDKHIFLDPALNSDDAPHLLGPQEWVNMQNFRIGSTPNLTGGAKGFLESVGSTILHANPNLPTNGVNYIIGSAVDEPFLRIVYFLWNSFGSHGIFCWDLQAQTVYTVLLSSQLNGGLNFDKDHLIHSAFVLNHCVYWTNHTQTEPRRLNIDAGIKLNQPTYVTTFAPYSSPLDISIISWIRRQPGMPPSFIKMTQTVPIVNTNFINKEAFQYCYRYIYRDYETGTLSGLSPLADFNSKADTFNRIDISIPLQETIQQDVIQVDLVARYMISGIYFVINSWQTSVPADAAAIAAHNAGTTPLTYSFYNDKIGIALDSAYSIKPFDSFPLYAGTCEDAKNRSITADVTMGYDSPQTTSLTITPDNQTASDILTGRWFFFSFKSTCAGIPITRSLYLIDIVNLTNPSQRGYYTPNSLGFGPPLPATIPFASLIFVGAGLFDVMNFYQSGCINQILTFTDQSASSNITGGPVPPPQIGERVFKTDSSYQAAVTFYDYYGRKCGVVTNLTLKAYIADRTYNQLSYTVGIDWTLSNANALAEIPAWAYYYSIDLTNSLRTRFFVQAQAQFIFYAALDSTGAYTFTTTTYAPTLAGIAIDISALDSFGQGYTFAQGDICKLYTPAPVGTLAPASEFYLSVIGQDGQYIIVQLADIGVVGGAIPYNSYPALFEIYTPYQPQPNEPYWEVGQIFPIISPTTALRNYSVIAGTLAGDVYILNRNNTNASFTGIDYGAENMSPNDTFYLDWFTNAGRPNFVDTIGQTVLNSSGCFSNTFINGAKLNGLSTYDPLDTFDISPDYGTIKKLQLTSKIQRTGSVLLAIGDGGETASIYLEENVLTTTTGETTIAQTTNFIGYINNLRGSYGTRNPESVVEYKGNVYWFDSLNGKYIQYSDSGLFPISNYKMTRFWKLFSDQYNSMTAAEIEALGSRPFVFSGIDPHNGELLVSIPQLLTDPPLGYFNDYSPAIPYPFDIWDGQAKSVIYKIIADPNKWQGSYQFTPEGFAYCQDKAFAFYQGNIYELNSTTSFCNLFGTQVFPSVMLVANGTGGGQQTRPKKYNGISIEANLVPTLALFRSLYPYEQGSDLQASDFTNLEGIFYARMLRDRLTPSFGVDYFGALFGGDKMSGTNLYVMISFDASSQLVQVKYANILYSLSVGHAAV